MLSLETRFTSEERLLVMLTQYMFHYFYSGFYALEEYGDFSVEAQCPQIVAWGKMCYGLPESE
ncbi:BnaC02g45260D [Brassica napus]|uniref:Uncharacterized protein n=2 Tax=Brassica TaxID=3705 RepID=A0A3P6GQS2_BRAOL|nr:unnamed protein product [Brassica napus]CDY36596.1 BnaC06g06490D [Brassica napus]CDY60943.1 BnaC02g45260D [Brassica napus]VDD60564.1 unnamed protein product [Brassica oleracea]